MKKIMPYNRMGGWIVGYGDYVKWVKIEYDTRNENLRLLDGVLSRMNYDGVDERDRVGYAFHKTMHIHDRIDKSLVAGTIYSCMFVEGFLNIYGTKRFGSDFYRKNIERVGITEKVQIIFSICNGGLDVISDEVACGIRRIFDFRNALVHPKTREIQYDDKGTPQLPDPIISDLNIVVDIVNKFILAVKELDDEIDLNIIE